MSEPKKHGGRRPGAGRKPRGAAAGTVQASLPQDLLAALTARAALEGCTVPDLARRALRLYLRSTEAIDRYAAEMVAHSPELQALDQRWAAEDAAALNTCEGNCDDLPTGPCADPNCVARP